MSPQRAFTLIELLFVVGIIAILAAISVPNFLEAQVRSKVARTCSDMATLNAAIRAYSAQYEAYPPNQAGIAQRLEKYRRTEDKAPEKQAEANLEIDILEPVGPVDTKFQFLAESGWDLARLTTPSAWVASSLPTDPFQPRQTNIYGREDRPPAPFVYINRHALFQEDGATSAPRQSEEENGLKGFILLSPGPDYQLSTGNPVRGPFVTYDPSNGSTSAGDLLLTAW